MEGGGLSPPPHTPGATQPTQLQEEELASRLSPRTSHLLWQPEANHPACGSPQFLILKNGIITIRISGDSREAYYAMIYVKLFYRFLRELLVKIVTESRISQLLLLGSSHGA